jgi:urease accessory protein
MYATAWSSETHGAPRRQRSHGQISFEVALSGSDTRPVRIAESGPSRVRLPNVVGTTLEGVIMNTGGGIACGDRFDVAIRTGAGADLVMTTPAAERIYRSDGPIAAVDVELVVEDGARLAWLPQETILYDQARLRRRLTANLSGSASLTMFEAVVFGRVARGEEIERGLFEDRWRISRDGRLVYADTLRLDGPISKLMQRPAVANGARALATFLYVAPDAEARTDEVRALLEHAPCTAAASAWCGLLVVRFLSPDIAGLRNAAIDFLTRFRGTSLPRVWHS